MDRRVALPYGVLAALAVASSLVAPFPGLELVKALPTAVLTVVAARTTRVGYGPVVTLGVACGSLGDGLLATASEALFLPGLVVFLLGHVAYGFAFARPSRVTRPRVLIAGCITAYTTIYAAYLVSRDPVVLGTRVALPVVAYVVVITVMAVAAVLHRSRSRLVALGAIVFVVSDSHIPINYFVLQHPSMTLVLTGYATYYLAQGLLVAGASARPDGGLRPG